LEMTVRDDRKLVEIWLTNAEKNDPKIQEGLKDIYDKYRNTKYTVAVFQSGKATYTKTPATCCCTTAGAWHARKWRRRVPRRRLQQTPNPTLPQILPL